MAFNEPGRQPRPKTKCVFSAELQTDAIQIDFHTRDIISGLGERLADTLMAHTDGTKETTTRPPTR